MGIRIISVLAAISVIHIAATIAAATVMVIEVTTVSAIEAVTFIGAVMRRVVSRAVVDMAAADLLVVAAVELDEAAEDGNSPLLFRRDPQRLHLAV
jgi:hypothetical protein